jgi:hypothetical protein
MSFANIFDGKTVYGSSWEIKEVRRFTEEEKLMMKAGVVEQGEYGRVAKIFMVGRGFTLHELSKHSRGQIGDKIDFDEARVLLLERDGETCVKLEL